MKEEYVNAFLTPAMLVWGMELDVALDFTGAKAVANQYTTDRLTTIIGINGDLKGNVLYEMSEETSLLVAARMLGENITKLDEIALSAIGELANMITGNAATELSSYDYRCDITPPVIIKPTNATVFTPDSPLILADFSSDFGQLSVRICLTESLVRSGVVA